MTPRNLEVCVYTCGHILDSDFDDTHSWTVYLEAVPPGARVRRVQTVCPKCRKPVRRLPHKPYDMRP